MNRPYTEEQVFDFELCSEDIAARLVRSGYGPWSTIEFDVVDAIIYDAMIALREAMLGEAE